MIIDRAPAVAGFFYPGDPGNLRSAVLDLLGEARGRMPAGPAPKAIIAPHAGYMYSGPIAASAYATLAFAAAQIRRVVLLGPSHRVPLGSLGASSARAFTTPLGAVPLDRAAIDRLVADGLAIVSDDGHAEEHSLEVHLPFLQSVLHDFTLIPLVVGRTAPAVVSQALEQLWGGPETLIVVSSDLSHYESYEQARALDRRTCDAIEACAESGIGPTEACGAHAINGLLAQARSRMLMVSTLDLRSSGDTAGSRGRVVGYGAWAFGRLGTLDDPQASDQQAGLKDLLAGHEQALLSAACRSIDQGLANGTGLTVNEAVYPPALRRHVAAFVTLTVEGRLRGCVGSPEAVRSLIADVAVNAFSAAFRDGRFPPLAASERDAVALSVSVIGPKQRIVFVDEADLLGKLRPGEDGLVIESGGRRALFLPLVWSTAPDPRRFLDLLKEKAGIGAEERSGDLQAWRFAAASSTVTSLGASGPLWV